MLYYKKRWQPANLISELKIATSTRITALYTLQLFVLYAPAVMKSFQANLLKCTNFDESVSYTKRNKFLYFLYITYFDNFPIIYINYFI